MNSAQGLNLAAVDSGAVDARAELACVLLALAGAAPGEPTGYAEDLIRRFGAFRQHEAVRLARAWSQQEHGIAQLFRSCLALQGPGWSGEQLEPADGRPSSFAQTLSAFALESGFADFFAAHAEHYRQASVERLGGFREALWRLPLEQYLGRDVPARFHVLVLPLFPGSGLQFTGGVVGPDGRWDLYATTAPYAHAFQRLDRPEPIREFSIAAWQLASAAVLDPLVERNLEKAERVRRLVCRAVTARLAARELGWWLGWRLRRAIRRDGYLEIDRLCAALERYERDRDRFPALLDFWQEWMGVLSWVGRSDV